MCNIKSTRRQSGFTLVELLIVAIILAILAAIIVPQFASTTVSAQESALRANATAMRSAIGLYNQQHGEYPSVNTAVPVPACAGTSGTGTAGTLQAFEDQLTLYSNAAGGTCSIAGALYPFGPYIQDDSIPSNPITDSAVVVIVTTGNLALAGVADGGWRFDSVSGKFIVDDTGNDSQGVPYSDY